MIMKTKLIPLCLLLLPSLGLAAGDTAAREGAEVAKRLATRAAGFGDQTMHIHMRLENAGGQTATRDIRVKILEREGAAPYSLVMFDSPRDVKGTALLSKGEDQWLYLPAIRRVRRVSSSHRSGPFVGSEFSYEDLLGNDPSQHRWRLVGEAKCGPATCLEVEATPKYEDSGYSRRVLSVRKDDDRLEKIVFFDRKGSKLKTLVYKDYQTHQGKFVRAHTWDMNNHQTGKRTVLELSEYTFGTGLSEGDFARSKLKRAR